MKQVSYVMRKTTLPNSKLTYFIIKRYIFNNGKLVERFWVNTYSNKYDAKDYFDNIIDNAKYYKWNIIKEVYCDNIWEISYNDQRN